MQEITGAKPVRDATFHFVLKALSAMHSLGKRISLVQFRVRAPPQSSQRSSRHHKPAPPRAALGIAGLRYREVPAHESRLAGEGVWVADRKSVV